MNLDEDRQIDVKVNIGINKRMLVTSLIGISLSIVFTGLLLYYLASDFIPTVCSIIIGATLIFISVYFPFTSTRFFRVNSEIVDIEEEELEELQSVMKPW